MAKKRLPFEQEIYEMEELLARLEGGGNAQLTNSEEIRRMRRELVGLKKRIYSNLTPWDTVLVARHEERPQTMDYVELIFDFLESFTNVRTHPERRPRHGFLTPDAWRRCWNWGPVSTQSSAAARMFT